MKTTTVEAHVYLYVGEYGRTSTIYSATALDLSHRDLYGWKYLGKYPFDLLYLAIVSNMDSFDVRGF